MTIEYLRGGIFLYTGDEAHFDSLVNQGFYSPVPAHEIPYDLRLEIQERLDARGIKGSSARQSTGTNEAGKNCWAPNKPCGKACRVNCKSDKAATGAGAAATKTKKAAAKKQVSEALAKKKKAAAEKPARTGPMSQKEANRELRRMVLGRKPSPKDGPEPKATYSTKISKKDYDAEEKAYIADVRAGKYGHEKDSESYADHYERMSPENRKSEFGNTVKQRVLDRRKAAAEKKNLPKLLKHHDITPEEHMAGVNAVHAQLMDTPMGKQQGFDKMSDAQKMARFGTMGAQRVVATRERVQEDKAYGKSTREKRAKLLEQAKEAGFSPQDILGKISEIIKEGGYAAPSSKSAALAMHGEQALAMLSGATFETPPPMPWMSDGKKGGGKAKKAQATKTKARKPRSAAPKATKASTPKARKPRGTKREKALEAQLANDPEFADIMRRRRDSRYDSWDFVPYYAQTGLPCLVDPFHAFR